MLFNFVPEEFLIYNEVKHNSYKDILNVQTNFKHNNIYNFYYNT